MLRVILDIIARFSRNQKFEAIPVETTESFKARIAYTETALRYGEMADPFYQK